MHSIRHWAALGRCSDLWCVYLMWPPNRTECGSTQLSSATLGAAQHSYHCYLRLPPNKVRKNKPQNELTDTPTHTPAFAATLGSWVCVLNLILLNFITFR